MSSPGRPARTAFLLAQVGSYAAARFADQVRPLGLTPAGAGLLRVLSRSPGLSQRALADRLGAAPSRVVVLLDALENAGLVARTRDAADRRHHRLDLTDAGRSTLAALRGAAEAQSADVLSPLDEAERAQLAALITKLADAHGLDPEVHRDLRRGEHRSTTEPGSTPSGPRRQRPSGHAGRSERHSRTLIMRPPDLVEAASNANCVAMR